jgi:hypothetical protein
MDYGLWIMDYGLWIMDYGLWAIDICKFKFPKIFFLPNPQLPNP